MLWQRSLGSSRRQPTSLFGDSGPVAAQRELCGQALRLWTEIIGRDDAVATLVALRSAAAVERQHLPLFTALFRSVAPGAADVAAAAAELQQSLERQPELPWATLLTPCLAVSLLDPDTADASDAAAMATVAEATRIVVHEPRRERTTTRTVTLDATKGDVEVRVVVAQVGETEPPMFAIWGLASDEELGHLAAMALDTERSEVAAVEMDGRVDPEVRSGRVRMVADDLDRVPALVKERARRLAAEIFVGVSAERCCGHKVEASLVQYSAGDHYSWHADRAAANAQDRLATLFLYLNSLPEDDAGGLTEFQFLRLAVRPQRGMALLWPNPAPPLVQRMLHRGTAPEHGVKLGMNIWLSPLGRSEL